VPAEADRVWNAKRAASGGGLTGPSGRSFGLQAKELPNINGCLSQILSLNRVGNVKVLMSCGPLPCSYPPRNGFGNAPFFSNLGKVMPRGMHPPLADLQNVRVARRTYAVR
jgi:hypothetical protein